MNFSGEKMGKRTQVKEIIMKEKCIEDNGAIYNYTISVRESNKVASYRIPLYSVSIKMTDKSGKETYAEAKDAFSDVGKALVFYERMIEYLATPLNLPYILEDEYCT